MLDMPFEDLVRDLKGNVVMYSNKPVYVEDIARDGTMRVMDLLSQRTSYVPFSFKHISAPRRIGFINIMGSVVYAYRNPVRKYSIGICDRNMSFNVLANVHYPQDRIDTKDRVRRMRSPEIGDAILNKYPTIVEAYDIVRQFRGAVAFDKQFALSSEGVVLYKTEQAGRVGGSLKSVADIKWNEGKEHLSILLDNNHEKTVRDFRPSSC